MKISINPLRVTEKDSLSILIKNMDDMQSILSRIKTTLNRQKQILDSLDKINRNKNDKNFEFASLVEELDKNALECTVSGVSLLDGRYSWNGISSLWFASGFRSWDIERIYLGTMTSAGLGIRLSGQNKINTETILFAYSRINKQLADIEGYSNRIRFTESAWKDSPLAAYSKIRLEHGIMEHQIEMIQTAKNGMVSIYAVLKRIEELIEKSIGKELLECQNMQVEVSALVDEVDRISSQTEYNRFKLLDGDFAKINPRASIWFVTGQGTQQKERIFIQTMTSHSLGIKHNGISRIKLTSGDSELSIAKSLLDNSIKKISDGIIDLDSNTKVLDKSEDLNIYNVMIKEIVL